MNFSKKIFNYNKRKKKHNKKLQFKIKFQKLKVNNVRNVMSYSKIN